MIRTCKKSISQLTLTFFIHFSSGALLNAFSIVYMEIELKILFQLFEY